MIEIMNSIINKIIFPEFTGLKCNMMPFIQGEPLSIPKNYRTYSEIIKNNFLEKGEIGFLTIDESFVDSGKSQRGFNSKNLKRNVHIEVGRNSGKNSWGGNSWGGNNKTFLEDRTEVLIANNLSGTCRFWNTIDMSFTKNGDLSDYIEKYPENTGILMEAGDLARISIFTPHECINQNFSSKRQFFRIIGKGVTGREDYFTVNPLIDFN
jgi:hypothetical protein